MTDLKTIYTRTTSQKVAVFAPKTVSSTQAAQLNKLEDILTALSSVDCSFSIELNGLDMAIGICNDASSVMIPFTLQDDRQGGSRILVDSTGVAPVAFDMLSDEVSFVKFLAVEQRDRVLRQNMAMGIAGYLVPTPAPTPSKP